MRKFLFIFILSCLFFRAHAAAPVHTFKPHCASSSTSGQFTQGFAFTSADVLLTVINDDDNDEQDIKEALITAGDFFHAPSKTFTCLALAKPTPAGACLPACRRSILYSVFRL